MPLIHYITLLKVKMTYINFIISRINYLPYYIPIVIEGNKRGAKSHFFLYKSDKPFISPYTKEHLMEISKLAKEYNITIHDISKIGSFPAITFFCEGDIVGRQRKDESSINFKYMTNKHIKVSLVCNYEYVMFYHYYIANVDYVVMTHPFWANRYKTLSDKNLYLGSPKYDMKYFNKYNNKEDRNKYLAGKYKLDLSQKYILIIFPKNPTKHHKPNTIYPNKQGLLEIYKGIRSTGHKIIVKSRKQDPVHDLELKGDYYFEDIDYYPCNSMELIEISQIVIFFSSSINEECVALKTPYIDLKVDMSKNRFEELNDLSYGICWSYPKLMKLNTQNKIKIFIDYLIKTHYSPDKINSHKVFENEYSKYIWDYNGSSTRILDWVDGLNVINKELDNAINSNI